ncbi:MAG: hypothetical protein RL027_611 [Pseudomonadota bacterium]|jgi:hypothetical protein
MINLKLAEYNKDGKFERFLELYNLCKFSGEMAFLLGQDSIRIIEHEICGDYFNYERDKKDPLKRFDGLFDGRTYGEGRFVLIKSTNIVGFKFLPLSKPLSNLTELKDDNIIYQDDFISANMKYGSRPDSFRAIGLVIENGDIMQTKLQDYWWDSIGACHPATGKSETEIVGNLHENPELYEKIK